MQPGRLQPYSADYGYHRPGTTDPALWTRVRWMLEPLPGKPARSRITLTTFGDDGSTFDDTSVVDAATLALVSLAVPTMHGEELADIRVTVDGLHAGGRIQPRSGTAPKRLDTRLATRVFGVGPGLLMATAPLEEGLALQWPAYNPLENATVWHSARVAGKDLLTVAGKRETVWVVEADNARIWVSASPPYVYRREFSNPDGEVVVVWELLAINTGDD
ncbi:MAG: hypothetical protein AAFX58_04795 [Pseudomonadota bacterium]